jgi:hypothetical protein
MYEERKNEKSVPDGLAILKQQRDERRNQRKLL